MASDMQRVRNKRGEGSRLREEIIAAATALLEETGSEDAITLRGVARRAGVAAPSIYAHFPDRDAIVTAVVAQAFAELDEVLGAVPDEGDPLQRLFHLCRAYLAFAQDKPHRYRVAFERRRTPATANTSEARGLEELSGGQAFGRLVTAVGDCGQPDCVTSRSPQLDATVLWVALHGYASLATSVPAFPWPDREELLNAIIGRIVVLEATVGAVSAPQA
jgi:AcrR family transcriptional regulator